VCHDEGAEIAKALSQGYAKAVSDSSYKDKWGTSGFCLFGTSDNPSFFCMNGVLGDETVEAHTTVNLRVLQASLQELKWFASIIH
jgi:hypothetical protein